MRILIGIIITLIFGCSIKKSDKTQTYRLDPIIGEWYLVSRNNLRLFHIEQDSISYKTTDWDSFQNEYSNRKSFKILSKKIINDTFKVEVLNSYTNEIEHTNFLYEEHLTYKRLKMFSLNKKDSISLILVTKEEVKSYVKLKKIKNLSEDDFINLVPFLIKIKNKNSSRHQKFSEIKYKLVEFGYNPLFQLSLLEKIFVKFSDNPKTKESFDQLNKN